MPKEKEVAPPAAPSAIDALIAAYRDDEEEYTYEVPRFGTVRARRLNDASEMVALQTDLDKYESFLNGSFPCPKEYADYKGVDLHVLTLCVFGARLLIEPKLSIRDLLRLSKQAGKALFALCGPLVAAAEAEDAIATNAAIESEGNE